MSANQQNSNPSDLINQLLYEKMNQWYYQHTISHETQFNNHHLAQIKFLRLAAFHNTRNVEA